MVSLTPTPDTPKPSFGGLSSLEELEWVASHLKAWSKLTTAAYERANDLLNEAMPEGATHRPTVPGPVGPVPLSRVTKGQRKPRIHIKDRAAFMAWLRRVYPELITVIPPSPAQEDISAALKAIKLTKTGRIVGPGNEADIPGLEVVPGPDPSVSVTVDLDVFADLYGQLRGVVPQLLPYLFDGGDFNPAVVDSDAFTVEGGAA